MDNNTIWHKNMYNDNEEKVFFQVLSYSNWKSSGNKSEEQTIFAQTSRARARHGQQDHLAQERVKVAAPDFLPCHNMEKGRAHIGGSAGLNFEKNQN